MLGHVSPLKPGRDDSSTSIQLALLNVPGQGSASCLPHSAAHSCKERRGSYSTVLEAQRSVTQARGEGLASDPAEQPSSMLGKHRGSVGKSLS